jgi:predicted Zn-dependent protease
MVKSAAAIVDMTLKMGVEEAICQIIEEKSQQVRFSNNEITAAKEYNSVKAEIFVSKGNKSTKFTLENLEKIEDDLKQSVKLLDTMQENKDHYGIAKGPFVYEERTCDRTIMEVDAVELAYDAIETCDAERLAGVLYTRVQDVDFSESI